MVAWSGPIQGKAILTVLEHYKNPVLGIFLSPISVTILIVYFLNLLTLLHFDIADTFKMPKIMFIFDFINNDIPDKLKRLFMLKASI